MQQIIVLEDNRQLADTLEASLVTEQLAVTMSYSLSDFFKKIKNKRFALCVMDRMIGDKDALESLSEVREFLPQARILMLSKKASILDRVEGFEAGADDYLPKPFSMAELRLRVRSLLSLYRVAEANNGISIGDLILYPNQGVLITPNQRIALTPRETEIVFCLARSLGTVVPRQLLVRTLWPETYEPNPSTIDVYVRRLRRKLGSYRSIIQTKRNFGYRLVPRTGKS